MNIDDRVKSYLGNGGLFNPECMEHDKVRDLITDMKEELDNLTEFCLDYQTYVLKNMRHKDESIRPVASEALRRMVYNYTKETTERTPKWGKRFENQ